MKNSSVWSWSHLFLPGAGADPIWSEPESALGLRTSGAGAAHKSGGSATLLIPSITLSSGMISPSPAQPLDQLR